MSVSPVRIKICGLTSVADAVACASAGADWVGLNFHPPSPRSIAPGLAAEIIAALPASVAVVGLFVDRPPGAVAETAERLGLKIVQLHGHEPPDDLRDLKHLQVVRAFRIGSLAAIERLTRHLRRAEELGCPPAAVLVDADVAGLPGGTGQSIAGALLDLLPPLPRLILAGGLTPENVGGRIARVNPWMVDVASGVESSPGRKDLARLAAFIQAARGV